MARRFYTSGRSKKSFNNEGKLLLISHFENLNIEDLKKQKRIYTEELNKVIDFFEGKKIKEEQNQCKILLKKLKPLLEKLVIEANNLGDEKFYKIKKIYLEEKRWFTKNYVRLHILGYAIDEKKGDKFLEIAESVANICDKIKEYSEFSLRIYTELEKILRDHDLREHRNTSEDFHSLLNNDITIDDEKILKIYNGRFSELQKVHKTQDYGLISKKFSKFFINSMADSTNNYKDWGEWVKRDIVDYVPSTEPDETSYFNESKFMKKFLNISERFNIDLSVKKIRLSDKKKAIEILEKFLRKIELVSRALIKGKEKIENIGHVYVLSNEAYPNIYKIGSTYGLPEERAEELTGTGHLTPFKVVGKIKVQSAEYYEKSIHKLLKEYRVKEGREFFKLNLDKIKQCLKQVSQISEKGSKKLSLASLQKEIKF